MTCDNHTVDAMLQRPEVAVIDLPWLTTFHVTSILENHNRTPARYQLLYAL